MGLDNGIIVKVPKGTKLPFGCFEDWASNKAESYDFYEICYWRKCWGIRRAILKVLDPEGKREAEIQCGNYPIKAEDIPTIITALKPFFSKEYWEKNSGSICEFDDMFETQVKHIINLAKLKEYLEENKNTNVVFYDSY